MVEVASPAVRGDRSRAPKLVVVDVRRQLVEARVYSIKTCMAFDVKTLSLPLVGGSYGPTWALWGGIKGVGRSLKAGKN